MEKKQQQIKNNIVSFIPDGDYYFNKALKALEREQMDRAYKYMKRAAELSPDDAHVLMQYGLLEMDAQNFEKAYELIHTAYCLEPDEPEHIFYLAEVSGCLGLMSDAKKYAEKYLEIEPNGYYSMEAREIVDFVEFEQFEMDDEDEDTYEQMIIQEKARRLMENSQFQEAIEMLEQLVDEYPELWAAYNNLSLAYFYVGDLEQSKAILNHVLRENTGNLHALCNLTIIAYYEKDEETLDYLVNMLKKINPFDFENRYKLGATLALIGEYEIAYKWLNSMSKGMAPEDPGFFFWLSQSAYFSDRVKEAEKAWETLVKLDPSKVGMEPWRHIKQQTEIPSLEQNRDFIIKKINSDYPAHRMFGFFLLSKSAYRQEIISHPKLIDLAKYNGLEKLCLAYALNHDFNLNNKIEKSFFRAMSVAEELYNIMNAVTLEVQYLFQMWFVLFERAFQNDYEFKNVKALSASVEYMYYSTVNSKQVTKKQYAEKYGISVSTLSKYVEQLLGFLPFD
ncbi:MAG: tetratricopeptide repeat protein [Lysinibacillus sp.]|nr:tetratricopeptide repeat protein [Lysinibacillus sp.]